MRAEESLEHPLWLIVLRFATFLCLPLVYLFLGGDLLAGILAWIGGASAFGLSGCFRRSRVDRSIGFVLTPPWRRSRRQKLIDAALGLFLTPVVMLFPMTLAFFADPLRLLADRQLIELFLVFYAAPWSLGGFLLYLSSRNTGVEAPKTPPPIG